MLSHLAIRDFAVVSHAELEFGHGLNVVSGETGAGKSLLVDALLWLTGARADAGIVRHGAERAELSAEFSPEAGSLALQWLAENDFDDAVQCQLRRVIRADGGSRAWINGRPATLAQLTQLGELLIEIHGQHEHQALLERPQQLALLDAFGRHPELLSETRQLARQWSDNETEIAALSRLGDSADRVAYLEHQLAELGNEVLDSIDLDELIRSHRRQANAANLLADYDIALTRLSGEDGMSMVRGLHQTNLDLARHLELEPRLADILPLIESAQIQIDEAASAIERLRDELDLDPAKLQQLESRLTRLHDLSRKHRVAMHDLADRRDQIERELESLRGATERAQCLQASSKALAALWRVAAGKLSDSRKSATEKLSLSVTELMADLGMAGGKFEIALIDNDNSRPNSQGAERCEFLVSANPGQPPRALRKVASGGELARISLAIEMSALGMDAVPSMVFDEVDSGIGGAVAEVVGQNLRALGKQRQVLCVTHLPQVAAQGHHHFQVSKALDNGISQSAVARLDDKGRIEELARMLGGVEIGRESRANARQMLTRAQSA